MPSLRDVQLAVPGADTVAGRVIAYHEGKHLDLGEHVGDGHVVLNRVGESVLAQFAAVKDAAKAQRRKKTEATDDLAEGAAG